MRQPHGSIFIAGVVIAVLAIVGPSRPAEAGDIDPTATASANWVYSDTGNAGASGNAGAGNFTVGPDVATVAGTGTNTQPKPPGGTSFSYAANSGAGNVGFTATLTGCNNGNTTTATATSAMNVGAVDPNGFYP